MINLLKIIKNYKNILDENKIEGIDRFFVFCDMFYCRKRFHATYREYFLYDFRNIKNRVRKNYLLIYHQRARYPLVDNDKEKRLGRGKDKQFELFNDFVNREWFVITKESISDILGFIEKHGKVIFKPVHGSKARGIFSLTKDEAAEKLSEVLPSLLAEEYICEEYLQQHPKMNEMNPNSVNTIRIMSLCDGNNVKIISAAMRTATDNKICDNLSAGGLGAAVDVETGIIFSTGSDVEKNKYFYHPVTNTQIVGFKIPFWEEAKAMVKEGAMLVKDTAIVGWDVAISPNGPRLIEANNRPAGRPAQVSSGKPCGEEIINYINKNWRKIHKRMPKGIKKLKKRYG